MKLTISSHCEQIKFKTTLGREKIESTAVRVEQCRQADIFTVVVDDKPGRCFLNLMSSNDTDSEHSDTANDIYKGIEVVELNPTPELRDYRDAMNLSNRIADDKLGAHMLLSWYDRDRNLESPQHSSECHSDSAVPGYVDYGLHHGASLKIDVEKGRFVFFYLTTDL